MVEYRPTGPAGLTAEQRPVWGAHQHDDGWVQAGKEIVRRLWMIAAHDVAGSDRPRRIAAHATEALP